MADGDRQFLETPDVLPHPLGRHLHHDPQNREYPIRALLPRATTPRTQPWWARHNWDQGNEGSCTAQAASGVVATSPFRMTQPMRDALPAYDAFQERSELYREAQKHDPWPGESYEGSSTDAPFKVLRNRGQIREWRWVFGIQDLRDTLNAHGPVAIGSWWYADMFHPDDKGYVSVSGAKVGGHAYEIYWWDADDDRYGALNSWGRSWGRNGRFWITSDQMETLLLDQGEAVTVVM